MVSSVRGMGKLDDFLAGRIRKRSLVPGEWYTTAEAASLLGVSERLVRKYIEQGLVEYRREEVSARRSRSGWRYLVSYGGICRAMAYRRGVGDRVMQENRSCT